MTDDDTNDAIALLSADHEDVRDLFAEYDELIADEADAEDRLALANEICDALTAHAAVEEELFYPAARSVLDGEELIDEAESEHASVRALVQRIQAMDPEDEAFDDTLRILAEAVEQHVQEEEGEIFPRVREAGLDLASLGEQIAVRKDELMAELGDRTEE